MIANIIGYKQGRFRVTSSVRPRCRSEYGESGRKVPTSSSMHDGKQTKPRDRRQPQSIFAKCTVRLMRYASRMNPESDTWYN